MYLTLFNATTIKITELLCFFVFIHFMSLASIYITCQTLSFVVLIFGYCVCVFHDTLHFFSRSFKLKQN